MENECKYISKTGGCNNPRPALFKNETSGIMNQPFSCSAAGRVEIQRRCNGYSSKTVEMDSIRTRFGEKVARE
jgi:hypothetical protein